MSDSNTTCWFLIEGAAAGREGDRAVFAERYAAVIRAYLGARWRQSPRSSDLDDAVQEVFVECFREGGILERADRERPGGFRAFLYGVARNVARRFEERAGRRREGPCPSGVDLQNIERDESTLSRVFDRAWARSLLREAFTVLRERAGQADAGMSRRVELLNLRFRDGTPIRDIARDWQVDAKALHREFDRAKKEFREALAEVVAFHSPGTAAEIEERCSELLAIVS